MFVLLLLSVTAKSQDVCA